MAEVEHFAYGWITPALAYGMGVLGALLGLGLTARSGQSTGWSRARWLALAGVAFGGTGLWLLQFMAFLGFDVPESVVRYDPVTTAASAGLAVLSMTVGLFVVGFGRPTVWKVLLGGAAAGVGVAATHHVGVSALRVGGVVTSHPGRLGYFVVVATIATTMTLWFAVAVPGAIHSARRTVGAALLIAAALAGTHYGGAWTMRVELAEVPGPVPGMTPLGLLVPVCVVAPVLISALAYATVGFVVRQENDREEMLLAGARAMVAARVRGRARVKVN